MDKARIEKMHNDLQALIIGHQRIVRQYDEKIRTLSQQVLLWRNKAEKLEREIQALRAGKVG